MPDRLFDDIPAGATISEISPLPSDPNVRRVRVGRRIVARLRASEVERLELTVGQEWTEDLAATVREAIELDKARKHAFTMLGRKGLSRHELIERLTRKGHEAAIAEQIADEFTADGWIDDAALAKEIVEYELERKPAAEPLLLEKLRKHRIADDVAQRIVSETLGGGSTTDQAMKLAEQRFQSMRSLPAPTAARRIAGVLHRRGFDHETIETVLNRMGLNDPE